MSFWSMAHGSPSEFDLVEDPTLLNAAGGPAVQMAVSTAGAAALAGVALLSNIARPEYLLLQAVKLGVLGVTRSAKDLDEAMDLRNAQIRDNAARRLRKGTRFFEKWRIQDPDNADVKACLLCAYLADRRTKEVIQLWPDWSQALHGKSRADILVVIALYFLGNRDLVQTEARLLEAVAVCKDHPEAWTQLALLYEQTDRIENALSAWLTVLEARPRDVTALTRKAQIMESLYAYTAETLEAWDSAKAVDSAIQTPGEKILAEATRWERANNLEKVCASLEAYLKLYPHATQVRRRILTCHLRLGDKNKALTICEALIVGENLEVNDFVLAGNLENDLGRTSKANEYWTLAFEMDNRANVPWVLWTGNGLSHMQQQQFKEALDCLSSALRTKPDYIPALHYCGVCHRAMGNLKEAENVWAHAVDIDNHAGQSLVELGNLLWEDDRREEAKSYWRRCTEECPDVSQAWVNLGATYADDFDLKSAERCFAAASRLGHPLGTKLHKTINAYSTMNPFVGPA